MPNIETSAVLTHHVGRMTRRHTIGPINQTNYRLSHVGLVDLSFRPNSP